jgi:hypothetical protein
LLVRIDDIHLYTNIDWASGDLQVSHMAQKFFEENDMPVILMNYNGSPEILEAALEPLRTWRFENKISETNKYGLFDLQEFPFLIYTEVHDDIPPSKFPRILLYGYDEIVDSNILELYKLGR